MKHIVQFLTFYILVVSCSSIGKVTEIQNHGMFLAKRSASIVNKYPIDLDKHKTLLVVPNDPYVLGMAKNMNYFDRVITIEDLEKEIIRANKHEEIGVLTGKIGLNNAYRKYKPFLYLRFKNAGNNNKKIQLELSNPDTLEEWFIAEISSNATWSTISDMNTFNPLFNAFILYTRANSKAYRQSIKDN